MKTRKIRPSLLPAAIGRGVVLGLTAAAFAALFGAPVAADPPALQSEPARQADAARQNDEATPLPASAALSDKELSSQRGVGNHEPPGALGLGETHLAVILWDDFESKKQRGSGGGRLDGLHVTVTVNGAR